MLRTYDLKVSGDHRKVTFDPAKCPTWDGPQSQVEALLGQYMGEGKPHRVHNFQLLDLKVGYVSARCSLGRITMRDVELCKEDELEAAPRRARAAPLNEDMLQRAVERLNMRAVAPEPVQQFRWVQGVLVQNAAPNEAEE